MAEASETPKGQAPAAPPPKGGGAAAAGGGAGAGGAGGAKPGGGAAGAGGAGSPPAPAFPPEAKTDGLAWLREVTTTTLAVLVVAVCLGLLCLTFAAAGKPDFAQKKDVMLYGLTILGTVVGYYFGRVPAERRAEASEETAKQAQGTASDATTAAAQAQQQASQSAQATDEAAKKLAAAKAGVEKAKAALGGPAAGAQRKTLGAALTEPGAPADRSQEALMELEVLSRLL